MPLRFPAGRLVLEPPLTSSFSQPMLYLIGLMTILLIGLFVARSRRQSELAHAPPVEIPEKPRRLEEVVVEKSQTWPNGPLPANLPFGRGPFDPNNANDGESTSSAQSPVDLQVPRRRSYTKSVSGIDVQGEVVIADGWKRHTRVYGGGVCKACEESERRMKEFLASCGRDQVQQA